MEVNVCVFRPVVLVMVRMNPTRRGSTKSPNAQADEDDTDQAFTPPSKTFQIQRLLKNDEEPTHGGHTKGMAKSPAQTHSPGATLLGDRKRCDGGQMVRPGQCVESPR